MKHSILFSAAFLLSTLLLTGCFPEDDEPPMGRNFNGYYKPVYANAGDLFKVSVKPARDLQDPGRIYLKDQLLIINERSKGFHVINNADPAAPEPLVFIEVPGAVNMAMQGQYMYVDNLTDLVTIDLSNLQQIREVNRQKDVFEGSFQNYPPFWNVGFECVDPNRGMVVGWELAEAPAGGPECWR